jgi:hypothetical protein
MRKKQRIRLFVVFRSDGIENKGTGLVTALSPDWLFAAKRRQKTNAFYGSIQRV